MINKLKICFVSAAAFALLASCQSQEPAQQPAVPVKKAPAKPQAVAVTPVKPGEEAQAKQEPPKRRNPFSNVLLDEKAKGKASISSGKRVKGPLECCELTVFRLIAVVNTRDKSFGLVLTPDGKRYFVHVGDMMGPREGKVVSMDYHSLIVRENTYDDFGKLTGYADTAVKLPEDSGGMKK